MEPSPDTIVVRVRRMFSREWRPVATGLVVVSVAAMLLFRLWRLHPRVPLAYRGDAVLTLGTIKNLSLTGWYSATDLLGVPYGQNLLDFPAVGDLLHLVVLWFLTDEPGLVLNAFYLASFGTTFIGAYIGSRMLRITPIAAVAVAVLYAFLPFHTLHGPSHLFLSSYGVVPLWSALAVRQMGDDPLIERGFRSAGGAGAWFRSGRHLGVVAIVVLGATTGLYYAVFMVVTVAVAAIIGSLVYRSFRRLVIGIAVVGLAMFILAVQFIPTWLYQRSAGSNAAIVERGLHNIEYYSLKLTDLFLPVPGHRVGWMAELRTESQALLLRGEQAESLGVIGVVGLAVLFAVAATWLLRGAPGGRHGGLAVVCATAVVVASVGGLATLLGVFGFTYLRAWGRISVLVAFCGLAVVGLAVDRLVGKVGLLRSVVVAGCLVLVGVLDTNPGAPFGDFDATAASWAADRAHVAQIEAMLGEGASVFQLPVVPFPEHPPVHAMVDYDHLRPYLHSDALGWSYGGVKGRAGDWQIRLLDRPVDEVADMVALAGFDGLWVDGWGYVDGLTQFEALLGQPDLWSPDLRQGFYDLRGRRAELESLLGDESVRRTVAELLEPVTASLSGFHGTEYLNGRRFNWAPRGATVHLTNPTGETRLVSVDFEVASAVEGDWNMLVEGGGGSTEVELTTRGSRVELAVEVPSGGADLALVTDAPRLETTDPRDIRFRVLGAVTTTPLEG